MLSYADVTFLLTGYLTNLGTYSPLPSFVPGPATNLDAEDFAPEQLVIISFMPGMGLDAEELFDRQGVQLRAVGAQMDYMGAEKLAQDCDKAMMSIDISQNINGKWTLDIWRAGGGPTLVQKDDGDRYHFFCNYIWEVEY
jgi:hypothetical protein